MEFGIDKYVMVIMKSWKRETTERTEQPNQKNTRTLGEKENYKYLEIWEADAIKLSWKKKIRKEFLEPGDFSKQNSAEEISSKE